ncbi:hypothetical protein CEXT_519871 [Caerostris extrusa]|uniref:Uncharacterized protein n=1 Tax=Caerostris extrusa TaxID=172846 RepID=A0AAV4W150_CAEEX|nr:hypothetical protein CEXT_519871 [Caerostris extrusa]
MQSENLFQNNLSQGAKKHNKTASAAAQLHRRQVTPSSTASTNNGVMQVIKHQKKTERKCSPKRRTEDEATPKKNNFCAPSISLLRKLITPEQKPSP